VEERAYKGMKSLFLLLVHNTPEWPIWACNEGGGELLG